MDLREQVKRDTEYFRQMFETLDDEGRFVDTFPNAGTEYQEEAEFEDLLRYEESLAKQNSLAFWR